MDGVISLVVTMFIVFALLKRAKGAANDSSAKGKKDTTYRTVYAEKPVNRTVQNTAQVQRPARSVEVNQRPEPKYEAIRPESNMSASRSSMRGIDHDMRDTSRTFLRDDRSNDWLAKQLSDERRAYREMRDMFDLRDEHRSSCEAEMIKRFHEQNCESGHVDTAKA